MRIIVGIGNPGREYDGTRHNAGFQVLNELAARQGLGAWRRDGQALLTEWPQAPGGKCLLMKPNTFVNRSGEAVQSAMTFYKLSVMDMLIVVDDIHLPLGHLRLRPDGSPGGHNGLKDIQARIGTIYPRLRVGVGEPPAGFNQVQWVLGQFTPDERLIMTDTTRRAADCCEQWLVDGIQVACRFNGPPASNSVKTAREPAKNSTNPELPTPPT